MVMFSRSTKPRPRHQPRVEALEERLRRVSAPPPPCRSRFNLRPPSEKRTPVLRRQRLPWRFRLKAARTSRFQEWLDTTPLTLIYEGTGTATHTGRFQEEATVFPTLGPDGQPISYTVEATLTAANGDQIFFKGNATFTSSTTTIGTAEVTGGTGRFKDAAGTIGFEDNFTFGQVGGITVAISDHQTATGTISIIPSGSRPSLRH